MATKMSLKKVLLVACVSSYLAGCAADGSYNGPAIWNDSPQRNQPKEIWNTNGQVNVNPPKTIWRRTDGTDVIPPVSDDEENAE